MCTFKQNIAAYSLRASVVTQNNRKNNISNSMKELKNLSYIHRYNFIVVVTYFTALSSLVIIIAVIMLKNISDLCSSQPSEFSELCMYHYHTCINANSKQLTISIY